MNAWKRWLSLLAALVLLLFAPRLARAQTPPRERSYSPQMGMCEGLSTVPFFAVDGFLVGRTLVDAYTGHDAALLRNPREADAVLVSVGALGAGYLGCGPVMHLVHRRPTRALASFGVRAALPTIAVLLTYGLERASNPDDGKDHSAAGLGPALFGSFAVPGSMGAALAIDHGIFAAPKDPDDVTRTARVQPSLSVAKTSAVLGVSGTF